MRLIVGIVLGVALAGGVAYASIPDSAGVIHGCYGANASKMTGGGTLSIVDTASASCGKNAKELTWNQTGPPGPKGDVGSSGPPGVSVTSTSEPAGTNCADGGVKLTSASGVDYACNGAAGTSITSIADLNGLSCTVPNGGAGKIVATVAGLVTDTTSGFPVTGTTGAVTVACDCGKDHATGVATITYRDCAALGTPGDGATYSERMLFEASAAIARDETKFGLGFCGSAGGTFGAGGLSPNAAVAVDSADGTVVILGADGTMAGHISSGATLPACPTAADPTWN